MPGSDCRQARTVFAAAGQLVDAIDVARWLDPQCLDAIDWPRQFRGRRKHNQP